jgi:uncharacterized membrane protein YqiK
MRIMSEKTNKEYNSVEECLADERAFDEQVKAEQERKAAEEKALVAQKEAAIAERKADAEKVEEARKAMIEAQKAYNEAMNDFLKKHKSYHYTRFYQGDEALKAWNEWAENFWNNFWF